MTRPNLTAATAKCRRLNVTSRSARPLIAASSTMSSSGSGSCGRQRNARRTGLATDITASSNTPTSALSNPAAARCSGRVSTASYSIAKGTVSINSYRLRSTAISSRRDAPVLLRIAETMTSVSNTRRTRDSRTIARDIASVDHPSRPWPGAMKGGDGPREYSPSVAVGYNTRTRA